MDIELTAGTPKLADFAAERTPVNRAPGDRETFARIYREHAAAISSYVHRRVGDAHLTEDLVADAFLAAWRGLSGWRPRGLPIRAWLYRIASNRVNRWARRERRKAARQLDHDLIDAGAAEVDAGLTREFARLALLTLPPKYQTALALHYLEGLPIDEVAQAVGCRPGTVKSYLSRGRDLLRARLVQRRSP